MDDLQPPDAFSGSQMHQQRVFGRVSAPDPTVGAYSATVPTGCIWDGIPLTATLLYFFIWETNSGTARWCSSVPTAVYVSRQHSVPTKTSVFHLGPSDNLCVPAVRLPTVGRRAFSVAGARVWNALPADVTSAPSLFTFRKCLKLHLFPLSYPGLVL